MSYYFCNSEQCITSYFIEVSEAEKQIKREGDTTCFIPPRMIKEEGKQRDSFVRDRLEGLCHPHITCTEEPAQDDIDPSDIVIPPCVKGSTALLYGRAGVGKTKLARWAMREWMEGRWGKQYLAMFVLDMHELTSVETCMSLDELLTQHAVFKASQNHPQISRWIAKNAERVLIWFGKQIHPLNGLLTQLTQRGINSKSFNSYEVVYRCSKYVIL